MISEKIYIRIPDREITVYYSEAMEWIDLGFDVIIECVIGDRMFVDMLTT